MEILLRIEKVEPDNPWMWFYRGRANYIAHRPHDAIDAFDRALAALAAHGNPDPEFADQIRSDRRDALRKVLSVSARLSFVYDSNVTYSAGGTTAQFITGRGDAKAASQFSWEYAFKATPEERISIGGDLSHAWHCSIEEFDFQEYNGYVSYARRLDERWKLTVRYDYDISYLGNEPFLSSHSLSPAVTYHWPQDGTRIAPKETQFDYRIESRDFLYETDPEFDRDGFVNSIGISQSFTFRPLPESDTAWDLYTGYRVQTTATEGSEFDRLTNGFYIGLAIPVANWFLPDRDALLQLSASWEIDDYRNGSLIDEREREREDVITNVGMVLSQELSNDPERGDVILHLILNWMDSDSNIRLSDTDSPFNYDKILAGIQFEFRF